MMILEHSSVHFFFIIYKSSSVETKFKCRKMLEYVYVARKWKMCSVNCLLLFFHFSFLL